MLTNSARIRECVLKNALAHRVPNKRESEILLLAGNKEGLKLF
jgi:hypothetical protein